MTKVSSDTESSLSFDRYGYYLVACLGVKVPPAIKKSITIVQMVQFALLNMQVNLYKSIQTDSAASRYNLGLACNGSLLRSIVQFSN